MKLAIQGHETRGKEVIQLLEMLGADRLGYKDTFIGFYYYIECDAIVSSDECPIDAIVFTLEEFKEKFRYKVGDKVIYEDKIREITKMIWEEQTNTIAYKLDDKLYCNVINDLQPYKEEKEKFFQAIKDNGYEWNSETKTLEELSVPSTTEKFYIRIGEIPSEERSAIYKGDIVIGYENGVSVYDCIEADGLYHIIMPFPLKEGQGMTYECLIQEITQCRYEIENPRKVYLVSGMEIGKGHDNEPLIKDVKILKDLTGQFNTKNDNTEETKTLEKLVEPKFKVGDIITKRDSIENSWVVSSVSSEYYGLQLPKGSEGIGTLPIIDQDKYELIPNKFDITSSKKATQHKFKVGDRIKHRWGEIVYRIVQITEGSYVLDNLYSIPISVEYMYNLIPNKFDITTLKPFESKVLVRDTNTDKWRGAFYSHYKSKKFYIIGGPYYYQCIPYEGNEYLLDTTNDCDNYYKNW